MRKKWLIGLMVLAAAGVTTAALLGNQVGRTAATPSALVGYDDPGKRDDSGALPAQNGSAGARRQPDSSMVIGLTGDRRLVSFRTNDPDRLRTIGKVTGLSGDTRLIGMDFRVQDGKLYGVGDRGGIYTMGTRDAKATKVSQLTVGLTGNTFDIDFNPAANRLRVVSDTGQNLRHNIDDPMGAPATGTTAADTTLTTPPAATPTTGVVGAAYTNNDRNASTATTLFDLNVAADQIAVQSPANQGELAPTGSLTVDAVGDAGFDISTTLRDGVAVANAGFATLKVDGRYRFYRVDLLTGRVSATGAFRQDVLDIALPLDQR